MVVSVIMFWIKVAQSGGIEGHTQTLERALGGHQKGHFRALGRSLGHEGGLPSHNTLWGFLLGWLSCKTSSKPFNVSCLLQLSEQPPKDRPVNEGKKCNICITLTVKINKIQTSEKYEPRHEKTCLCHMRTTKAQISLHIYTVWSAPFLFTAWIV